MPDAVRSLGEGLTLDQVEKVVSALADLAEITSGDDELSDWIDQDLERMYNESSSRVMRHAMYGEPEILVRGTQYLLKAYLHAVKPPEPRWNLNLVSGLWSPDYFWYLYNTIGRDCCWYEKNQMTREQLSSYLAGRHCLTLLVDGIPSGMGILASTPKMQELSYFGMMPHAIGQGYGKWFIQSMLAKASEMTDFDGERWDHVYVETCSLDHQNALPVYKNAGFVVKEQVEFKQFIPVSVLRSGKRLPVEVREAL